MSDSFPQSLSHVPAELPQTFLSPLASDDRLGASALLDRLATVRQMLELLGALEKLGDPLTSAAGLREAIGLLAQLAAVAGIDPPLLDRVVQNTSDPTVFNVLLAVVQLIAGFLNVASAQQAEVDHAS